MGSDEIPFYAHTHTQGSKPWSGNHKVIGWSFFEFVQFRECLNFVFACPMHSLVLWWVVGLHFDHEGPYVSSCAAIPGTVVHGYLLEQQQQGIDHSGMSSGCVCRVLCRKHVGYAQWLCSRFRRSSSRNTNQSRQPRTID